VRVMRGGGVSEVGHALDLVRSTLKDALAAELRAGVSAQVAMPKAREVEAAVEVIADALEAAGCARPMSPERDGALNAKDSPPGTDSRSQSGRTGSPASQLPESVVPQPGSQDALRGELRERGVDVSHVSDLALGYVMAAVDGDVGLAADAVEIDPRASWVEEFTGVHRSGE
jgi:hypothetical protein